MTASIGAFWVQAWILAVFLLVAPAVLAHVYYGVPDRTEENDEEVRSP